MATAKKTNPEQMSAFDKLAAQSAEKYADAWKPEKEGENVAGTIVRREVIGHASQYGPYPVLTLAVNGDENNKVSVHCFHHALRSNMETAVPGDMIAVTYLGKQRNKADTQTYENYGVALATADGVQKAGRKTEYDQHTDPPTSEVTHPTVVGPGGGDPSTKADDDIPF